MSPALSKVEGDEEGVRTQNCRFMVLRCYQGASSEVKAKNPLYTPKKLRSSAAQASRSSSIT